MSPSDRVRPGGVGVIGVGRYVPEKLVTNEQVAAWTGMSAAAIEEKTGIRARYVAADGETASAMAATAASQALETAGVDPARLGIIVACTFTGDYVYPAMACRLQQLIGARSAGAFDLMANCTGFQVGLDMVASRMMVDPTIDHALVVGAALQSRFIDWSDADSAIYFGDGASAAVLGRVPEGYGIIASDVYTNPAAFESVRLRGGGSSHPLRPDNISQGLQYYEVDGLEVWKQVVRYQPQNIRRALEKAGMTTDDVDVFIFHQANLRLIEYLMGKMRKPMSMTYTNVAAIGNTADASIGLALCDAVRAGAIRRDDIVAVSGVGAGFTFGTSVLRWY
ncbi:MAG: 3-oxoacyl-ACP synthase III family protein [Chloroflexi bacterium]|nr:3-oxoacyl-ACP synthase III family protein [Chloroflexota bacterium]